MFQCISTRSSEVPAHGGQAATSAKIRNYLGFPWGRRGADLAAQASQQATQLGAEVVVARDVTALRAQGDGWVLQLSSADVVSARAVILAGGVTYRRTGVAEIDALIGHGVFYGAAAGAAVTVLIRGDALGRSMSDYLVRQLEGTPDITVRTRIGSPRPSSSTTTAMS